MFLFLHRMCLSMVKNFSSLFICLFLVKQDALTIIRSKLFCQLSSSFVALCLRFVCPPMTEVYVIMGTNQV